jgi:Holliday junction resolvase RusA-like endonuclease
MSEISLIVYGEPVAQARAGRRNFIKEGKAKNRAFDPEKSASFKDRIYDQAVDVKPDKPWEGQLRITIKAYRSIPKSMPKYKLPLALAGEVRPTTKPDLDNYIKGVKDALRGVIWRDDAQVVSYGDTGKWYSEVPRVEITVMEI